MNYTNLVKLFKEAVLKELEKNLLVEDYSISQIKDGHKTNLTDEQIKSLIDYDPFLYKTSDTETISSPCILWLASKYQDVIKYPAEKVRNVLKKFIDLSKQKKINFVLKNKQGGADTSRDPNRLESYFKFSGVEDAINSTEEKDINISRENNVDIDNLKNFDFDNSYEDEVKEWAKKIYSNLYSRVGKQIRSLETFGLERDLKKVYEGRTVDIFQPLSYKGSVVLRCGSDMAVCIGDPTTEEHYENYIEVGDLLYIINKDNIYRNYAISIPWQAAKDIKETGEEYWGEKVDYEKLRNESIFLLPKENSLFEIEDKHDKPIIPYDFFFNVKPEVFEFLKQNKEWLKKINLCINVNIQKGDFDKFLLNLSIKDVCKKGFLNELKRRFDKGLTEKEKKDCDKLLSIACKNEKKDIVEFLLNKGFPAEPKRDFENNILEAVKIKTPLILACENGDKELAEILLNKGADVNAPCTSGGRPLFFACRSGNKELVKLLLDRKANIEDKWDGDTPLTFSCQRGNKEIVELLLDYGANIEAKNKDGTDSTSLIICCKNYIEYPPSRKTMKEIIKLLLDRGANIDAKQYREYKTSLMLACEHGEEYLVEMLLDRGANIEEKNINNKTALYLASEHAFTYGVIDLLLNKGANINTQDSYGDTPLMNACVYNFPSMVEYLLEKGADFTIKNNKGETPLDYSIKGNYNREEIVELLKKYGAKE